MRYEAVVWCVFFLCCFAGCQIENYLKFSNEQHEREINLKLKEIELHKLELIGKAR